MPSPCATVVTAKLQEPMTEGASVLFEPDQKWTGDAELQIEDSLVRPDSDGKVKPVIHNPSNEAKILGDLIHVGSAKLCDDPLAVQAASEQPPDGVNIDVHVVRSQKCDAHPRDEREQEQQLSKMLNVSETNLSSEEAKRTTSCFLEANGQSRKMSWGQ